MKWSDILKSFHKVGFTDQDYGLISYDNATPINSTVGVGEYAIGDKLKKAFEDLGFQIEIDIDVQKLEVLE